MTIMDWLKKAEAIFFYGFQWTLVGFPAIYSLLLNCNSGNYLHLWHHFVWTSEWGGNYDINLYASQSGGGTMTSICMHLRVGGGTMTSICMHLRVGGELWHHFVGISEWGGGAMTSLCMQLRVGGGTMTSHCRHLRVGGDYDITL